MQLASITAWITALLVLSACATDVRRTSTATGDDAEEGGAVGGGADTGGEDDGDAQLDDVEPDEEFAMCPAPPPRPGGLRDGSVPAGVPDEEEASAIFQRASHEVGHVVTVLLAESGDPPSDLLTIDGDTIAADSDDEALRGTISRDAATGRVCVALRFGSWTGGHGGWGLSALDGTMLVLVEDGETTAVGTLGLVESGPLDGAAPGAVGIHHDGELLSGSVDRFDF